MLVAAIPVLVAAIAALLAAALRRRPLRGGQAFAACVVLGAAQLAATLLTPESSQAETVVLGMVATLAEAGASTLLMFVFLKGLACLPARQAGVSIAAGYLLVHLYDGAFIGASEAVRVAQRPLALVAMIALAGVWRTGSERPP